MTRASEEEANGSSVTQAAEKVELPRKFERRSVFLFALAGALLSVLISLQGPIRSGLREILPDAADGRFEAFIMERNANWLESTVRGRPPHRSFWDLQSFYPRPDSLLYSDTLIGQTPFWWVIRALGFGHIAAFHVLIATFLILNFGVAFWFVLQTLGCDPRAAAVAGFLIAAGAPRASHLAQLQLLPLFPTLVFLYVLARATGSRASLSAGSQLGLGALVGGAWAMVFHFSLYLAWFLVLALAFALVMAVARSDGRAAIRYLATRRLRLVFAAAAVAAVLVLPVLTRHARAGAEVGARVQGKSSFQLISPSAWLHLGRYSLTYGEVSRRLPVASEQLEHEKRFGLGLLTTALALFGLWRGRKNPKIFWFSVPIALLCLLFSRIGSFEVWSSIQSLVPGGQAIRAVARAGMLAIIPAAIGLALAFDAPWIRKRAGIFWLLAILVLAEQLQSPILFPASTWTERPASIVSTLPETCESFFYSPIEATGPVEYSQMDALWASLLTGIPTINGYSGAWPRDWTLWDHSIGNTQKERHVAATLVDWVTRKQLSNSCWIRGTRVTPIDVGRTLNDSSTLGAGSGSTNRAPIEPGQEAGFR